MNHVLCVYTWSWLISLFLDRFIPLVSTDPVSAEVPDAASKGCVPALTGGEVGDLAEELGGQAGGSWGEVMVIGQGMD